MDTLRSYTSELIARTIVHEFSHNYAGTDDKSYCKSGACPSGLSIADALDNADSYACFAYDLWFSGI
jgi:Lysine-specific metallo-endopeptidase